MRARLFQGLACAVCLCAAGVRAGAADLAAEFRNPPQEARPRVYWTWLHAYDKARISFELEEMKKKGIGGFLHWESGAGGSRYGTRAVAFPSGPAWMSPEWREYLLHAFREADRLGLEASLAITPGANCGGPWVTPAQSAQKLVWGTTSVSGPAKFSDVLALPDGIPRGPDGAPLHYRDIAVFAAETYRLGQSKYQVEGSQIYPVTNTDNLPIGNPWIDVTSKMDASGKLVWDVPPGVYRILRFGYTSTGQFADYAGGRDGGFYADHMSKEAVEYSFTSMLGKLFGNGPLPRSLKYVHCDSYEVYNSDWTPKLLEEFRQRRGYDPLPFLPTLDGGSVESRAITARFRADLNKTRSDCFADNHYQLLYDLAHSRGLGLHSESAGPRINPVDALKMLGRNDVPMGEFWSEAQTHRVTEEERFYIKHVASAAHIYGKQFVAAEAFTSIGGHWEEDPWSLKASGDLAFLEGANRFFLHTFSHSPERFGKPGIEYFAGTHFNANNTWWEQSRAWFDYLSRCQYLLSRGLSVADVLYYYGDQVPSWVPRRHIDPSLGAGYEYDVTNAEVILKRMSVRGGRITLPDGMSYRVLALPDWKSTEVEVLRKIGELIKAGATVVGAPPTEASGLQDHANRDKEVAALVQEIWGSCDGKKIKEHRYGEGRVIWGKTLREVLTQAAVAPDFEVVNSPEPASIDAIHRSTADSEIYFVVNRSDRWQEVESAFRVIDRAPELWDPASGETTPQSLYSVKAGRTVLPMRLAPRGSVFVVFRGSAIGHQVTSLARNGKAVFPAGPHEAEPESAVEIARVAPDSVTLRMAKAGRYTVRNAKAAVASVDMVAPPAPISVPGPWTVRFTPGWGAPEASVFPQLASWSVNADPGIKYFSGTAEYDVSFDVPEGMLAADMRLSLDLGEVANLAEVRLNGTDFGVLWKPPFRLSGMESVLRARDNRLSVRVTNLWVNRLIGDESLPADKRFTNTNMFKFTQNSPLRTSGLIGPVRVIASREKTVKWATGAGTITEARPSIK